MQKLNLRALYMSERLRSYGYAVEARRRGIPCDNDPDVFKQEALKYAKILGDDYLHFHNTTIRSFPFNGTHSSSSIILTKERFSC